MQEYRIEGGNKVILVAGGTNVDKLPARVVIREGSRIRNMTHLKLEKFENIVKLQASEVEPIENQPPEAKPPEPRKKPWWHF